MSREATKQLVSLMGCILAEDDFATQNCNLDQCGSWFLHFSISRSFEAFVVQPEVLQLSFPAARRGRGQRRGRLKGGQENDACGV